MTYDTEDDWYLEQLMTSHDGDVKIQYPFDREIEEHEQARGLKLAEGVEAAPNTKAQRKRFEVAFYRCDGSKSVHQYNHISSVIKLIAFFARIHKKFEVKSLSN